MSSPRYPVSTASFRLGARTRILAGLIVTWLGLGCYTGFGQWTNQSITLNPGWNAIYLEVQPAFDDCDVVFAGIPVESVWAWNRRFSTVQFIEDAANLIAGQPDWLTWLPVRRRSANVFSLMTAQEFTSCQRERYRPTHLSF